MTGMSHMPRWHRRVIAQHVPTGMPKAGDILLVVSQLLFMVESHFSEVQASANMIWPCMHALVIYYIYGATPNRCNHAMQMQSPYPKFKMLALIKVVRKWSLEIPGKVSLFVFSRKKVQFKFKLKNLQQYQKLSQNIFNSILKKLERKIRISKKRINSIRVVV